MPVQTMHEVPFDYEYETGRQLRPSDIAEETRNYRQPPILQGVAVNWFGNVHDKVHTMLGFVQRVRPGVCVDLFVPGAAYPMLEGVRHISDPRHKLGREHSEMGGWDYTDAWKEEQALRQSIETRLAALEAAPAWGQAHPKGSETKQQKKLAETPAA